MRLINAHTLLLHEFHGDKIPPYAILSHTWGDEEMSFQDWRDLTTSTRPMLEHSDRAGYTKVIGACEKALTQGLEWVWADTTCIDKTSSSELTEAINSMFTYYREAKVCFAYLSDVYSEDDATIENSRWFTRGWTLQELLAPATLIFYDAEWNNIGQRDASLTELLSKITNIGSQYLIDRDLVGSACVSKKMSWLSHRKTTRIEDMAYCMLGIFDINMPLLYGEGMKAFIRLQEEIIKTTNDHTIFCWKWTPDMPAEWTSFLAPSPAQFQDSGMYIRNEPLFSTDEVSTYFMTNAGLSMRVPLLYSTGIYYIILEAGLDPELAGPDSKGFLCIKVSGQTRGGIPYVSRSSKPASPIHIFSKKMGPFHTRSVLIMRRNTGLPLSKLDTISDHDHATISIVSSSESLLGRLRFTEGANSYLITVNMKPHSSDAAIGVGLVKIWLSTKVAGTEQNQWDRACILVGIKTDKDQTQPMLFLALCTPEDDKSTSPSLYERIQHFFADWISSSKDSRDTIYCKNLDLSIVMQHGRCHAETEAGVFFLHISNKRRTGYSTELQYVQKGEVGFEISDS